MNASADKPIVVVTGANGYIGSTVIARLSARYRLVALDSKPPKDPGAAAAHILTDLTSDESVASTLRQLRADYGERVASLIHLAAYFDLNGTASPLYRTVNVEGTLRLMRAFESLQLEQFVFVSTLLVHAPGRPGQPITEDWPLASPFPYPASKIATEAASRKLHGKLPLVLLRPAGVYDDLCHSAFLSHQIARIYERRLISHMYPADLATGQPFLHLDDLTDAIERLVERRGTLPPELPLLLGEESTLGFGQLQDEIGRLIHGSAWPTLEIPAPLAKTAAWLENEVLDEETFIKPWMVEISDDHYEIDCSRARALLDWRPQHSLKASLAKMIEALKRDPEAWYRANKLNVAQVAAAGILTKAATCTAPYPATERDALYKQTQQMRKMHFDMLWVHFLNLLLGAWLSVSPFLFGAFTRTEFSAGVWQVTLERDLVEPALRNSLLGRSEIISGVLIMVFALLSLSPRRGWAQWANSAMGTWVLFAPLLFWAPGPAAYNSDTLIGALVIAFAVIVPMMPGMAMDAMMDTSDLPAGWTYNPSTYLQRLPIIALGVVGFFISYYLAAYQLGHITSVWEPFFAGSGGRNGTETIITSHVSKAWPVADAGLGAIVYLFEILMGAMGDRRRWRTMPWMVAVFGVTVIPLGAVSIYFIIIQPIVIGTWCTLCLIAAVAMLIMIPYSLDEVIATGQFLAQTRARGAPFWRTFFRGAAQARGEHEQNPGFDAPLAVSLRLALRDSARIPVTLMISVALGVWLMFSRLIFGTLPPLANSDHLLGALIVTVSIIAIAEVARPLRFLNGLLGVWLIVAPWLLAGRTAVAAVSDIGVGLIIIALCLPRGTRRAEHYGSWDRLIV